jgi:hypothetical protein
MENKQVDEGKIKDIGQILGIMKETGCFNC